jgi:hypothetical protein
MDEVPALNLLAISAIQILAMDCMAPSLAAVNIVNHIPKPKTLQIVLEPTSQPSYSGLKTSGISSQEGGEDFS